MVRPDSHQARFLYLKASRLMDPDENREPSSVFMQMQTFSCAGISGPEWIRAVLRQFDGRMDISKDNTGNTRFYVSFKL